MPTNDEGNLAAPGVDEAGPASVQGDVVSILAAKTHRRVLKWRLSGILQYYTWEEEKIKTGKMKQNERPIRHPESLCMKGWVYFSVRCK